VLGESAYLAVADRYPNLEQTSVEARGKEEPVMVRVIEPHMLGLP
jgi:hypothetical protein